MPSPKKRNAPGEGGDRVDRAGQRDAATQEGIVDGSESTTARKGVASKSTSTEAQHERLLTLLRQGPKTTLDLREHGILMPATRVFELKAQGLQILSERIPLYDNNGFRHSNVARYRLEDSGEDTAKAGAPC